MFCKRGALKNFANFTGKLQEPLFYFALKKYQGPTSMLNRPNKELDSKHSKGDILTDMSIYIMCVVSKSIKFWEISQPTFTFKS